MNGTERNNKRALLILIPATVIMIVLAVVVGIYANKAGGKSPASLEEFKVAATSAVNGNYDAETEEGFVFDLKEQVGDDRFKEICMCRIDEGSNIFYYEFKNKGDAKSFFAGNARKLKKETVDAPAESITQEDLESYSYYSAQTEDRYVNIIRVNKTVLYVDVEPANKEKAEKVIKMLNY